MKKGQLKFLIKFSWRNLGRHPMRTLIMAAGLCFGTGYIIFALNFSQSGSNEVIRDFLKQYFGYHQIVAPRYYPEVDKKNFDQNWTVSEAQVAHLDQSRYTRRVTLPVFISGPRKTLGTLLTGIDVAKESQLSYVPKTVTTGNYLHLGSEREILLGKKLARKVGAAVGDEVAVIGQALDGSVANDIFRVVGLLDYGGGDMEDAVAFTALADAQAFAVIAPDRFHQLVSFDPDAPLPALKDAKAVSWKLIVPEIAGSVEFIDRFTWLISAIMVMVICLGLSNTLMITFLERSREFNSLNIIGARSTWVTATLVIEVLFLGALGILSGVAFGYLVTWFFHHHPISLLLFTKGRPIMMGGISIVPKVRLWFDHNYAWQAPLLVSSFLVLALIWPVHKVIQRSRRAD